VTPPRGRTAGARIATDRIPRQELRNLRRAVPVAAQAKAAIAQETGHGKRSASACSHDGTVASSCPEDDPQHLQFCIHRTAQYVARCVTLVNAPPPLPFHELPVVATDAQRYVLMRRCHHQANDPDSHRFYRCARPVAPPTAGAQIPDLWGEGDPQRGHAHANLRDIDRARPPKAVQVPDVLCARQHY